MLKTLCNRKLDSGSDVHQFIRFAECIPSFTQFISSFHWSHDTLSINIISNRKSFSTSEPIIRRKCLPPLRHSAARPPEPIRLKEVYIIAQTSTKRGKNHVHVQSKTAQPSTINSMRALHPLIKSVSILSCSLELNEIKLGDKKRHPFLPLSRSNRTTSLAHK